VRTSVRPYITEGATAQVISATRLGQTVVNILPASSPGPPVEPGGELPTDPGLDPGAVLDRLRDVSDSVGPTIEGWSRVLARARQGPGTLSRLLTRPDELEAFRARLDRLALLMDNLAGTGVRFASVLQERQVRSHIAAIAERLPALKETWSGDGGSIAALAADTLIVGRLRRIESGLDRIASRVETGRGTVGRLLHDEALATEWMEARQAVRELRSDLEAISRGERPLGPP
jgi:hypothetical protein